MCEFSGELIAWMDGELPERGAADVERHLEGCAECRERIAAYRQASRAFDAYCEVVSATKTRRELPRWVSITCGAGIIAAAAAIVVLLILPRGRVAQAPARTPALSGPAGAPQAAQQPRASVEAQPISEPVKKMHRRSEVAPVHAQKLDAAPRQRPFPPAAQIQNVTPLAAEPPIEIAIPADAMFPPGAVPEGMSFTADLTIAADGSTQRLGLRPRLAGFERRGNQP